VFGVFGCVVEERRREIGIHMALGATGGRVVGLLFEGARTALVPGLIGGAVLSAVAVVLLRGFLYGLSPLDPWTYVAVGAILVASGAAATWFPARRAERIEPAVTLRAE
jgi:ABC-type lipoprotein release transport system permease subunit